VIIPKKNFLSKPVTENYSNQSLDDYMTEMIRLRHDLNSTGSNFNQTVKKLHILQQIAEFKVQIIHFETGERILLHKVSEIKDHI